MWACGGTFSTRAPVASTVSTFHNTAWAVCDEYYYYISFVSTEAGERGEPLIPPLGDS